MAWHYLSQQMLFCAIMLKRGRKTNAANISEPCWLQSGTGSALMGVSWKGSNGRKTQKGREGEMKSRVPHYYPNLCLAVLEPYIFSVYICQTNIPPKRTVAKLLPGCSSTSSSWGSGAGLLPRWARAKHGTCFRSSAEQERNSPPASARDNSLQVRCLEKQLAYICPKSQKK